MGAGTAGALLPTLAYHRSINAGRGASGTAGKGRFSTSVDDVFLPTVIVISTEQLAMTMWENIIGEIDELASHLRLKLPTSEFHCTLNKK